MSVDVELTQLEQEMVDAIRMRRADRVAECLEKGVGTNFVAGSFEERPLHLAAQANCPAIIEILVAKGAPVDTTDYQGQSALFHAADKGSTDAALTLLALKANPNHVAHTGRTAIFSAALNGNAETIDVLMRGGADPNFELNGATPLFYAVNRSRYDAARALVNGGARVDYRNPQGLTAGETLALKNSDYGPDRLMAQFLNATHLADAVTTTGTERKITPMKALSFRPGTSS
jgi:ankyrin repeat protein